MSWEETQHIHRALRRRHGYPANGGTPAWVYVEEVRVSTGFTGVFPAGTDKAIRDGWEQRIDAFAIHSWPSKRFVRRAYEIKASTSDLRRELSQPDKCAAALALSNEFYLVAGPAVKVLLKDLPEAWGVIRISETGESRVTREAPWRDTPTPPFRFMLSIARNLQVESQRSGGGHTP